MNGTAGTNGTNGQGLLTGGTANQVLAKIDGTDYNTQWVTPATGGTSLPTQTGNTGKVLSTDGTNASWEYKGHLDLDARTTTPAQAALPAGTGNTLSTMTTVIYNQVLKATSIPGASYNSSTGIYTVGLSGLYLINGSVLANVQGTNLLPSVQINGSLGTTYAGASFASDGARPGYKYGGTVQTVVDLVAGDTIRIVAQNSSLTTAATIQSSSDNRTRITITKL
jgi:hypothetical protein